MARITKREAVEVLNMRKVSNSKSNLLAFATVRIDNVAFNNVRLVTGKNGVFMSMPQEKGSDGNYYNTVWADTGTKEGNAELYDEILEALKEAYENL